MPKYQIVSPHEPEECLRALDEILADEPEWLDSVYLGCHYGDHTGYALIDAANETEALNHVPPSIRGKARAIRVERETPERIRSYHQKAA